jgi:GDP-D-mannose 3', 5'-epimerase
VDECIQGTLRLMRSDYPSPVNIGSEEMVSINQLAHLASEVAGKTLSLKHIDGPTGVRGRNSDNDLAREVLGWEPSQSLKTGIEQTYNWIKLQTQRNSA